MVLVVDPNIAIATPTPSLEFRAEGIWAHHVCETAFEHWTVGLEAFGVTLDHPDDAAGDQWGKRTAVGLDLEWESSGSEVTSAAAFEQRSVVTGEVLIDDRVVDFSGTGRRRRSWAAEEPPFVSDEPEGLHVPVRLDAVTGTRRIDLWLALDGSWTARRG